jgi:hypothetical protein
MIERTDNHSETLISIATANMANSPHLMSFDIFNVLGIVRNASCRIRRAQYYQLHAPGRHAAECTDVPTASVADWTFGLSSKHSNCMFFKQKRLKLEQMRLFFASLASGRFTY